MKSRYLWGKLFILLSVVVAIVIVLYTVWLDVDSFRDYSQECKTAKNEISAKADSVLKAQKDFEQQYKETVEQLQCPIVPNSTYFCFVISSKGKLEVRRENYDSGVVGKGFALPNSITQPKLKFNTRLVANSDVQESKNTLDKYEVLIVQTKQKIKDIVFEESGYRDTIPKIAQTEQIPIHSSAPNITFSVTGGNESDALEDDDGSRSNSSIFAYPDATNSNIEHMYSQISDRLFNLSIADSRKILDSSNKVAMWLYYLRDYVANPENNSSLAKKASNSPKIPNIQYERRTTYVDGFERKYGNDINALLSKWNIDYELIRLKSQLDELESCINRNTALIKSARRVTFNSIVKKTLVGLFAAFIVLVFSDYLKAHFDMAEKLSLLAN